MEAVCLVAACFKLKLLSRLKAKVCVMKQSKEPNQRRKGVLSKLAGRIGCAPSYWLVLTICMVLTVVSSCTTTPTPTETRSDVQWNIMVVPSQRTVFSENSRVLFNKNCASCHSKDGRAQTPIARQRHVQDLSECKLEDDKLVEQILEGTHNKTNTFKMPPFKEKFSRGEVEALVPLVKAFRPVPPTGAERNQVPDSPRLAGLINFPGRKYAVLEKVPFSGHYFILAESESHDGVTLGRIKPKKGSVQLWGVGTNPVVTLNPDRQLTQPKAAKAPGFRGWIAEALHDTRHEVALEQASTDLVLFLHAQFTGRTSLRSPRLPAASFSLNVVANNPAQIALRLESALAEKGISTIRDGEKFLLVVPTSEAPISQPLFSEFKASAGEPGRPGLFPKGAIINFPNTELSQVVKLYADLTGRALDRTQQPPSLNGTVNFTTQTALTKEECAYGLETLLALQGFKIVPAGRASFRLNLISDNRQ